MKAIQYYQYGGPEVVRLEEIPKPKPGPCEILVKVSHAALNPLDWRMVRAEPALVRPYSGIFKPRKHGLGGDFSGVVDDLGEGAQQFSVGDAVFGTAFPGDLGSLAEYVVVKNSRLHENQISCPPLRHRPWALPRSPLFKALRNTTPRPHPVAY